MLFSSSYRKEWFEFAWAELSMPSTRTAPATLEAGDAELPSDRIPGYRTVMVNSPDNHPTD